MKCVGLCASIVLALLLCSIDAKGVERTWTSQSGKYSVAAEIIGVKKGFVRLRRSDGKLLKVQISRLCQADQEFLRSVHGKVPQVSAKLEWSKFSDFSDDGRPKPRSLNLLVTDRGKQAKQAIEVGFVRLNEAKLQDGSRLQSKKNGFSFDDLSDRYELIQRGRSFGHPPNGIQVTYKLEPPKEREKILASVAGQFKIKCARDPDICKLERVVDLAGTQVRNKTLKRHELKANIDKQSNSISINLSGYVNAVSKIELKTPRGKPLPGIRGTSWSKSKRHSTKVFDFANKIPADAVCAIHLSKNMEETFVPFQFTNLRIPAPHQW